VKFSTEQLHLLQYRFFFAKIYSDCANIVQILLAHSLKNCKRNYI